MKVNLAIVNTPRHWLITLYLIREKFMTEPTILLVEDTFLNNDVFVEIGQDWFEKILFFPSRKNSKRFKFLKKLFREFEIKNVFSGSANEPFIQYCSYLRKQNSLADEGAFYLLDDGLFSYQTTDHKRLSTYKLFERKLQFGRWYQRPSGYKLGVNWVDAAYLLFPDKISRPVNKPILKIESNWLDILEQESILSKIVNAFGVSGQQIQSLDYFIILDLFRNGIKTAKDYEDDILQLLQALEEQGIVAGVKYHPRDKASDPLKIQERFQNHIILPGGLPFEALAQFVSDEAILVGDISTILLEMKQINPVQKVIVSIIGSHDLTPLALLEENGVSKVNRYEELISDIGSEKK